MSIKDNYKDSSAKSKDKTSKFGLALLGLSGGVAIAVSIVGLSFISPALRKICLPYVPATTAQINNVMTALSGRSGRLIDIGSGDGRIVLAAAKMGFRADGVELNPWLVAFSRLQAYRLGLASSTKFYRKNLWKFNLQPYQNIVIFGVEEMMLDLEDKLCREIDSDTYVVACRFPFPTWIPDNTFGSGIDTVWLYKNPVTSINNKMERQD
ncbi:hypothetical protein L9F63_019325 [Diploptera punctata]|uniref:ATP synthase subunit C lysine N-methyltransferase n=1 Tax=Diploptera punctata TaxID=6984 RepID=A0AAD7ZUW2_DIPPU|nr:hypothetical protein L9F63_019325 [Diploptera punctata]